MLDYAEFNIATLATICYLYFSIMLDYAEFNIATLVTIFYLYFTIFFTGSGILNQIKQLLQSIQRYFQNERNKL